jgi:hypothetical protein
LEDDIEGMYEDLTDEESLSSGDGDCLFDPQQFEEANKPLLLKDYKMTESELVKYAHVATQLRQDIVTRSALISDKDHPGNESHKRHHFRHVRDLGRAHTRNQKPRKDEELVAGSPLNDFIAKRKTRRLKELPLSTRLEIAHSVIVGLRSQREVAVEYNVKPALVNTIIRVFKKRP